MMTTEQVEHRVNLWLQRVAMLDREGLIAASRAVGQCARELEADDRAQHKDTDDQRPA